MPGEAGDLPEPTSLPQSPEVSGRNVRIFKQAIPKENEFNPETEAARIVQLEENPRVLKERINSITSPYTDLLHAQAAWLLEEKQARKRLPLSNQFQGNWFYKDDTGNYSFALDFEGNSKNIQRLKRLNMDGRVKMEIKFGENDKVSSINLNWDRYSVQWLRDVLGENALRKFINLLSLSTEPLKGTPDDYANDPYSYVRGSFDTSVSMNLEGDPSIKFEQRKRVDNGPAKGSYGNPDDREPIKGSYDEVEQEFIYDKESNIFESLRGGSNLTTDKFLEILESTLGVIPTEEVKI